jgi:DNA topoisomerase VI subunit B
MMATQELKRETFRTSRLLDFMNRKELIAQTGHQPAAWPMVVLKELVDNALDACEDRGIAPVVQVKVDQAGITVSDNGPGIPVETIEGVLDFSIRVSNREAYISPTRGAQGNALKTIVAMPFVLSGEEQGGRADISTNGMLHEIGVTVDRVRQEPVVTHETHPDENVKTGTVVRVNWPASASSILKEAKSRFLQIAEDYTWLNPHLSISINWFGEAHEVAPTDPSWKKWLPSDPTSPHWYRLDNIERLISACISRDASQGTNRTVREFISGFRGLTSTGKQKALLDTTGMARMNLSELVDRNRLSTERIHKLLIAMKAYTKQVKPEALGIIGKDHLAARCVALGAEMESFQYRLAKGETDGVPWVIETAFVWLGDAAEAERRLITGVNWSPGILNPFRELGNLGNSLDTILAQQHASRNEPVVLVLHMASARVEYTDRGKSAVVIDGDRDADEAEEK